MFKTCIGTEPYVKVVNNRCHRCILSLFRAGSLQLKVETGRYARPPEPLQDRLCIFCDSGQIEDEKHFLFNCCFYSDIRHELYSKACLLNVDFEYLCDIEKLCYLMCNENMVPLLASSLYSMFLLTKTCCHLEIIYVFFFGFIYEILFKCKKSCPFMYLLDVCFNDSVS